MDTYGGFIYEAAFMAQASGYFKGERPFAKEITIAMGRILRASGLQDENKARSFLAEHKTVILDEKASALYQCALENHGQEFFSSLSGDALRLYHSANFDVSREYGNYLAGYFPAEGMSLADIGGSSGGLLTGLSDKVHCGRLGVFDGPEACETGRLMNPKIEFNQWDFFTPYPFTATFDAAILSNVLHDWPDKKALALLNNLNPMLRSASYLIIHEDILADNEAGPQAALMYGLRLTVHVPGGRQRTVSEISKILAVAAPMFNLHATHNFGPLSACIFQRGNI